MHEMYERHLRDLEQFANEVNFSDIQKIRLYQIARTFFEDGGIIYNCSFSNNYKWSPEVEKRLTRANQDMNEIAKELIKIEDSIGVAVSS